MASKPPTGPKGSPAYEREHRRRRDPGGNGEPAASHKERDGQPTKASSSRSWTQARSRALLENGFDAALRPARAAARPDAAKDAVAQEQAVDLQALRNSSGKPDWSGVNKLEIEDTAGPLYRADRSADAASNR